MARRPPSQPSCTCPTLAPRETGCALIAIWLSLRDRDCAFMRQHADAAPLGRLQSELRELVATAPLPQSLNKWLAAKSPEAFDRLKLLHFHGGMEDLGRFHATLVRGGVPWA